MASGDKKWKFDVLMMLTKMNNNFEKLTAMMGKLTQVEELTPTPTPNKAGKAKPAEPLDAND